MKKLVLFALLVSSASAMACLPSGLPLKVGAKRALARALKKSNPACAAEIESQIGNLTSTRVAVFASQGDQSIEYVVIGKNQMTVKYVKIGGKMRYSCGEVTGLKRCM
jgi:hypothetical protein